MRQNWTDFEKHLIDEIRRLNTSIADLASEVRERDRIISNEVSALKVKASMFGFVGGAIAAAPAIIFLMLKN